MNYIHLDQDAVNDILPDRPLCAHKGNFGKILLLSGSRGYTGAAALCAMGALRSGSGLVYLGVPESIYEIEAVKLNEAIVFPLPDTDGKLGIQAIDVLEERLGMYDAVLIGPGLGRSDSTFAVVKYILSRCRCPVVLDADGINLISEHKDILRGRSGITVLTPHEGEFERLIGRKICDRVEDAVAFSSSMNVITVLKGHDTVITDGAQIYINKTGNPGMAVGGCGDVLAGMVVSLIGQGLDSLQAAACAVWLHGAAGDICAETIGQYGMLPSDMLNVLPRLLK